MRKKSLKMMLLLMGVLAISIISCSDDDDALKGNPAEYLIGTTVKNPDGMSGSSFMKLIDRVDTVIDNSHAIQMNFGTGFGVVGEDVYVFPSFGKDGNPNLRKYRYQGTDILGAPQEYNCPPNSAILNIKIVNSRKAYLPASNIGKVFIINPQTMEEIGKIDISEYAYNDNSPEASNGIIRDGFYYLCLDQVGSDYMPYPDYRQVDVLIIDTKTDKVVKMISEKTSNLSFPTRPMDLTNGMIFTNEQDDIYISCVGNFGYDPSYLNSGFVCIPSGKQEFDVLKTWDISQTLIEGTQYRPASVYNTKYIGNGKVIAYVGILELIDPKHPYTCKNSIAVLMDLNSRTIKRIEGIPATDGHSVCIRKYKEFFIIGSYGEKEAGFYTYNVKTEEVKLTITTVGNPTDFHYFE